MSEKTPTFLVDAQSDPVVLRINGRASYLNCAPVRKLFDNLLEESRCQFLVDFRDCSGMDSTFLGILAGVSMEVRRLQPPGYLKLCRLNERNMELVCNLGLHRLMGCTSEGADKLDSNQAQSLPGEGAVTQETILEAHQKLMDADSGNVEKFQDVVSFLKKQVEQD